TLARLPKWVRRTLARIGSRLPTSEAKVSFTYKLRRFLRAAHLPVGQAHFSWNGAWLPEEAAALVRPACLRALVERALADVAARHGWAETCSLFQLQCGDMAEYLPNDILAKTDRMSMAHGLECRSPFLEHDLAAWA